jgi:single-stranded DNA-binding protein
LSEKEYKSYDSADCYEIHNARLTKDATVIKTEKGMMVRLSFASTCRSDRYETLWVEATVGDFQSGLAQHLKKGDVLGVKGKPGLRKWTDDDGNERFAFELSRAEIFVSPALFVELKERGFAPGGKADAKKPAKGKKAGPVTVNKKKIEAIPDDDDDADDEDDGDEE